MRRVVGSEAGTPFLWALLVGVGAGCGYTVGTDLGSRGIQTMAVDVVGNATFRARLELPLTAEIYRVLPTHLGVRPAPRDRADAVLSVEIEDVQGLSLISGGLNPVREGALHWTIRVVLRDRRTGAILVDQPIADRSEFRTPVGENTRSAVQEATADLARKIALALEPGF